MISDTQTVNGVTSKVVTEPEEKHLHYPFWDLENCTLKQAEEALRKVQREFSLSHIYISSDAEGSYRAWCFDHVPFKTYLLILLKTEYLDWNFFHWTADRGKATLRVGSKKGRLPQKCVCVLESYPHPFPKRMQKVEYDTGVEKEGINILLDVLTDEHIFRLKFQKPNRKGFSIQLGQRVDMSLVKALKRYDEVLKGSD
jgi:hypothetical protein